MVYDKIISAVAKLVKKHGTRDPHELCELLDIELFPTPLGKSDTVFKGFFLEINRIKTITYNSDMPDKARRIILGHELGHAVLHSHTGLFGFDGAGLLNSSSVRENEANLFAAELLIDDDEVLDLFKSDYTFEQAAGELGVPPELLDYKCRLMKSKGHEGLNVPIYAKSTFLRDVEVGWESDGEW